MSRTVASALPPELAAFAETLTGGERMRTASETWHWLRTHAPTALAERHTTALVAVASVYATLCAPPAASSRHLDVVARFTLLFFLVDDAELEELPDLLAPGADWSIGRHTEALRVWLGEFREQQSANPRLRARFASAYHDYLAARRAEGEHKSRPLDLAEHWAFRRRSIFMDPYLDLWLILCGIDLAELAEESFAAARARAVDLVLLANDLGSAERDARGGASPDDLNLIHSYAREHAVSEHEALERLIDEHNGRVERFREALAAAVAARPGPHAERYVELLTGVVDGNIASVLALGFRYPGAEAVMRRLRRVGD
jgi:hypothetical protein